MLSIRDSDQLALCKAVYYLSQIQTFFTALYSGYLLIKHRQSSGDRDEKNRFVRACKNIPIEQPTKHLVNLQCSLLDREICPHKSGNIRIHDPSINEHTYVIKDTTEHTSLLPDGLAEQFLSCLILVYPSFNLAV